MIALVIIVAYILLAGVSGGRHHQTSIRDCYSDHFSPRWCGHALISVWLFGALWPITVLAFIGIKAGSRDKESRIDARRRRELDEAKHKAEIARIERVAAEDLSRQLRALERGDVA